jgi:hypothetical protein
MFLAIVVMVMEGPAVFELGIVADVVIVPR